MNSLFQKNLLVLIIFTQIILWLSYQIILPKYKTSVFWGKIPKSSWNEFLIFAAIAYILNLLLYFYFVFKNVVDILCSFAEFFVQR